MSNESIPFSVTIHVRDHCLCLHAQRAARALARRFDKAFKRFGITNGQFSLLMSLNRPQPAPMGPVASLLAMDRTTLTAALKPLERRGLLTVAPDPRDKRGRLLSLTDDGRTLLTQALPVWVSEHAAVEDALSRDNADDLRDSLRELGQMDTAPLAA
ncbi:MarR family winged helix-turn-helix transcriptional regulator [Agrobacterium sp. ES01]|uniref:MarR family winged helix-turn-helix transcriptional regulator n=1 Tax=Agrobacterium sp. ES01 TaxID=3420714 RepID=UPI003D0F73E0